MVLEPAGERFARLDVGVEGDRIAALVTWRRPALATLVVSRGCWRCPDCRLRRPRDPADRCPPDPASTASRSDAGVDLYVDAAVPDVGCGVTTVRDVGGWNYVEMAVREAIEAGELSGPRLFLAGRLLSITTATTAYYPGMYEVADGVDEVRRAVRRQLARGADVIKVMATGAMLSSETEDARAIEYSLDELPDAVEVAHANFKPVAAHRHAARGSSTPWQPASTASSTARSPTTTRSGASLLPARSSYRRSAPVSCWCATRRILAAMPEHLRQRMVDFNEVHLATIGRAHELGVRIAMGTDAGTPGNHHGLNAEECVLMATRCGLSPAESIRAATIHGAALLRRSDVLGTLEVGKYADVIACAGNPLESIEELTRLMFVMKAGEVVRDETARWSRRGVMPDQSSLSEASLARTSCAWRRSAEPRRQPARPDRSAAALPAAATNS